MKQLDLSATVPMQLWVESALEIQKIPETSRREFPIYSCCFQITQSNINIISKEIMYNNVEPGQQKFSFSVMLVPSFCHFYNIELNGKKLVAKVFPSDKQDLFQQEEQLMNEVTHPNLPKPIHLDPDLHSSLRHEFKGDLILYPSAQSNLLAFVQRLRGLPEPAIRYYLKQIVTALIHVKEKRGLSHQNLNLENVLVDESKNVWVCGWSNSKGIKNELFFSIGEMCLRMMLGHGIFVRKEMKFDPVGKFLTEGRVDKFWDILGNSHRRIHKGFAFPDQFKSVVSALFLQQLTELQKLEQTYLEGDMVSGEEVQKMVAEKEMELEKARKKRLEKESTLHKKEKKIVAEQNEYEESGMDNESARCVDDPFYEQYSVLKDVQVEIPPVLNQHDKGKHRYYRLFDSDPKVILAHLRTRISDCQKHQEEDYFMHPLLTLKKEPCYASLDGSEVKVSLPVSWSNQGNEYSHVEVGIALAREKEELWGAVSQTDNPDLSDDCLEWVISWLRQTLEVQG